VEQLDAASAEFADLFSKAKFSEAFSLIRSKDDAAKMLTEFELITRVISNGYHQPGIISKSSVGIGDIVIRYGIVTLFHKKVVTFLEKSAVNNGEALKIVGSNVKAKSKPSALLNEIPRYFYTERDI